MKQKRKICKHETSRKEQSATTVCYFFTLTGRVVYKHQQKHIIVTQQIDAPFRTQERVELYKIVELMKCRYK